MFRKLLLKNIFLTSLREKLENIGNENVTAETEAIKNYKRIQ